MYKPVIEDAKVRMEKTLAGLKKEYSTLRAGRANPQILDKITVDYYGTPTALSGVANISSPEPRLLVIAPWEAKNFKGFEPVMEKSYSDGKLDKSALSEYCKHLHTALEL